MYLLEKGIFFALRNLYEKRATKNTEIPCSAIWVQYYVDDGIQYITAQIAAYFNGAHESLKRSARKCTVDTV